MADWGSMADSQGNADFLSMYTTKTQSPPYMMNGSVSELQFSPSPKKSAPEFRSVPAQNGNVFCTSDNIEQAILYLNQEMTSLGMPSLYVDRSDKFDIAQLANCTFELLHKHRHSMRTREEFENRQHRTDTDIEYLQQSQNRMKVAIEEQENELVKMQEKERQLLNKNKLLTTKLKAEKEEVRRLQSVIQHRDAQYKHEVKKKERELIKLKERLQKLLSDKTNRGIGLDIANPLSKACGKRGRWKTDKTHEEEMFRTVISNYEDKQKELMIENSELRQCLSSLQKDLVELLHSPTAKTEHLSKATLKRDSESDLTGSEEEGSVSTTYTDELSDAHFQLPYEFVRDGIQRSFRQKCKLIKERMQKNEKQNVVKPDQSSPSKNLATYKKEIETLNKQIARYRQIIEQQEQLIQQLMLSQEDNSDTSFLRESNLLEEREAFENEKQAFNEQKANFETERQTFTEAAIRLGRERKTFDEEKAAYLTQQFMQITPFREDRLNRPHSAAARTNSTQRSKRLLPSTPNFSPAPKGLAAHSKHIKTPRNVGHLLSLDHPPSTVDLYRTLGLDSVPENSYSNHGQRSDRRGSCSSYGRSDDDRDSHGQTVLTPLSCNAFLSSKSGSSSGPSSRASPAGNSSRHSEHMENVKMVLFRKRKSSSGGGS